MQDIAGCRIVVTDLLPKTKPSNDLRPHLIESRLMIVERSQAMDIELFMLS